MIGKIALHVAVPLGLACSVAAQSVHMVAAEQRVQTPHSYKVVCAASRWVESKAPDSLSQPQAKKPLARKVWRTPWVSGSWCQGLAETTCRQYYAKGARQLVLLGAGFDARPTACRASKSCTSSRSADDIRRQGAAPDGRTVTVFGRHAVATEFTHRGVAKHLEARGFSSNVPTVWLLEGLLMYLSLDDTRVIMGEIGRLSAPGSLVFTTPAARATSPTAVALSSRCTLHRWL